jgi:cytochrome b561
MRMSRKTLASLKVVVGAFVVLLQLFEPKGGFERVTDFESVCTDLFHGIVYAACLALIVMGIRTLLTKQLSEAG